jgi:acyl-coenzyme A thioesterase PaaI-like protein
VGADYESFPGVVHGGIIGTILDEVMGRAVLSAYRQPALTVGLRIRFAQVMETGRSYLARASITSDDGTIVKVRGQIEHAEAGLVAVAEGTFVRLTRAGLRSGPMLLPELALDATGHNPEYAGEVTHE